MVVAPALQRRSRQHCGDHPDAHVGEPVQADELLSVSASHVRGAGAPRWQRSIALGTTFGGSLRGDGRTMRDSDVNLYRPSRLFQEFGPFLGEPGADGTAVSANDIVGAHTDACWRRRRRSSLTSGGMTSRAA